MDRFSFITTFLLVLIPLLLFAFSPSGIRRCSFIGWDSYLYVSVSDTDYQMQSETDFNASGVSLESFLDRGGILINQRPRNDVGPWEGSVELYVETSYMPDAQSVQYQSLDDLSKRDKTEIFDAVIAYAVRVPELAAYSPGRPPVRDYVNGYILGTAMKFFFSVFVSILAAGLFTGGLSLITTSTATRRHRNGLCVNCAYDCEGLTTPICPECGDAYV